MANKTLEKQIMTNRNRNTPCSCGSGLKQKKCHRDPVKMMLARKAYKEKLHELIELAVSKKAELEIVMEEKQKEGLKNNFSL